MFFIAECSTIFSAKLAVACGGAKRRGLMLDIAERNGLIKLLHGGFEKFGAHRPTFLRMNVFKNLISGYGFQFPAFIGINSAVSLLGP